MRPATTSVASGTCAAFVSRAAAATPATSAARMIGIALAEVVCARVDQLMVSGSAPYPSCVGVRVMFSKSMIIGSCIVGALASIGSIAGADNITASGTACQNYNAAEALDIDYVPNGVRNINASPRWVVCSIPRSPLTAGASAVFYVDGHNNPGTSTTCWFYVHDYSGNQKQAIPFTPIPDAQGNWDYKQSFPAGVVQQYDYTSVLCQLPGNYNGLLYGAASVQ
jgi:hypothetical protein